MMYVPEFCNANPLMIAALDNGALGNRMALRFELQNNQYPNNRLLMMTIARPGVIATVTNEAKVWQHIAVTFDGNTTRLYINGNDVGQTNFDTPRKAPLADAKPPVGGKRIGRVDYALNHQHDYYHQCKAHHGVGRRLVPEGAQGSHGHNNDGRIIEERHTVMESTVSNGLRTSRTWKNNNQYGAHTGKRYPAPFLTFKN